MPFRSEYGLLPNMLIAVRLSNLSIIQLLAASRLILGTIVYK